MRMKIVFVIACILVLASAFNAAFVVSPQRSDATLLNITAATAGTTLTKDYWNNTMNTIEADDATDQNEQDALNLRFVSHSTYAYSALTTFNNWTTEQGARNVAYEAEHNGHVAVGDFTSYSTNAVDTFGGYTTEQGVRNSAYETLHSSYVDDTQFDAYSSRLDRRNDSQDASISGNTGNIATNTTNIGKRYLRKVMHSHNPTYTTFNSSTTFTLDDNVPLGQSGHAITAVAITPTQAGNDYLVAVSGSIYIAALNKNIRTCVFRNNTCIAMDIQESVDSTQWMPVNMQFETDAPDAAADVFLVTVATDDGTAFRINGNASTRIGGGTLSFDLIVTEYEPTP